MKSAIITGAAGNLGKAVVKKFVASGYHVIGVTGKMDESKPEEGLNAEFVTVDLSDEKASEEFIRHMIIKYKTIDVAVLTVGGFEMGTVENTSTSDLLKMYNLNFLTAYHIARPVFLQMLKQGHGRIFLTGAKAGIEPSSSSSTMAYSLSKSLIFHFAEILNAEARGKDVVTTVIVPSVIDTPQNRRSMPDADHGSWVQPDSIAEIIFYHTTSKAGIIREPVIKIYGNV